MASALSSKGSTWQWRKVRQRIVKRDRHTCQLCGAVTLRGEVDHIMPRHLGGGDHPSNLRYLCKECHAGLRKPFFKTGEVRHVGSPGTELEFAL